MENKTCKQCGETFTAAYRVTARYWATRKYCSSQCRQAGEKGRTRSTLGKRRKSLAEAFWSKVDKRNEQECWIWTGAKEASGYGFLSFTRQPQRWIKAHRLSYILANGDIADNMCVCHSCDNPTCVNPHHLWLGTRADNNADKQRKGRNGIRRGQPKLTEEQAMQVFELRANGWSQQRIADLVGVSQAQISRILLGKSRKRLRV